MSAANQFRLRILNQVASIPSFAGSWDVWRPLVDAELQPTPTGANIFALGEKLSEIFKANASSGRGQSSLSGGGVAWECLITWYLNLIFWNTNIIATRYNQQFVPQIIADSIAITIAGHRTNTESDILVFSIPDEHQLVSDDLEVINRHLSVKLSSTTLSVVQCKTNWNDNAQIPMLWDLLYNANGVRIPSVNIGAAGVSPNSYRSFFYSFVTVPSNQRSRFEDNSLAVLRVRNLTGGNYWGYPTKPGVVACVNELFGRQFPDAFSGGVQAHIDNQLRLNPTYVDKFIDLIW